MSFARLAGIGMGIYRKIMQYNAKSIDNVLQ
jgi:hypothetical protein